MLPVGDFLIPPGGIIFCPFYCAFKYNFTGTSDLWGIFRPIFGLRAGSGRSVSSSLEWELNWNWFVDFDWVEGRAASVLAEQDMMRVGWC